MEYLPTLGEEWPHSRGNVGKYSLHGSFGHVFFLVPHTSGLQFESHSGGG